MFPRTSLAAAIVALSACLIACGASDEQDAWWPTDTVEAGPETGEGGTAGTGGTGSDAASGSGGAQDASADQQAEAAADAQEAAVEAGEGACEVLGVPGECLSTPECASVADHASTPGFCSGPADIQCCTPYGTALCDPNIEQLPNAQNTAEAPGEGGCPAGMIPVDTFCVDKFEASLVRVSDGTSWSPYFNPGTAQVLAVSVQGAVPQGYINQEQASAACENAGKRLCTDTEWLRACQGPGETTYPYGDTLQVGACNDHRDVHPAVQYFGTNDTWIWSELGNACIDQLPMSLEPSGNRSGCVTAEGAYDMMGNLHEWTADPAGTFRGGFYVDTVVNGPGCLYATTAHNTLHWDYSTGFRCCAD